MGLTIENDAYHMILILNHNYPYDEVVKEINEVIIRNRVRRLVLYVVSPEGRPAYLERLRTTLTSIIHCSLIVRYGGSIVDDLIKLVKSYPKEFMTALISSDAQGFKEVLDEAGINYKLLGVTTYT